MSVTIYADGCCIGNHLHNKQERQAYSAFIVQQNGVEKHTQLNRFEDIRTNQQAEWAAIVLAVKYCQKECPGDKITIFTDCQTVVKMINGEYKARAKGMVYWSEQYDKYAGGLDLKIKWLPREKNLAGQYLEKHLSLIRSLRGQ